VSERTAKSGRRFEENARGIVPSETEGGGVRAAGSDKKRAARALFHAPFARGGGARGRKCPPPTPSRRPAARPGERPGGGGGRRRRS
jgi:hypothetical protein